MKPTPTIFEECVRLVNLADHREMESEGQFSLKPDPRNPLDRELAKLETLKRISYLGDYEKLLRERIRCIDFLHEIPDMPEFGREIPEWLKR